MTNPDIDKRLQEIVHHAYTNAPATKRRLDNLGLTPDDIQQVADLVKIPPLSKDEVIALQQESPPFGGLLAVPQGQVRHIFFSPGPLYEPGPPQDSPSWEVGVQSLRLAGFEPGEVVLNSLSYHLVPAGLLLDESLVRLGCVAVPGGTGNSDLQLKMVVDLEVTGYVGTASFLMSLIKKAEAMGLSFETEFQIKKALVSAEPLPPDLRQVLTETYHISVANAYATAEAGLLAVDLDGRSGMKLFAEPIVQVVDLETGVEVGSGEAGEVVITDFNQYYPLIRFGTGDMAINLDPNPGQSQQAERGLILIGRSGEAAKVRGMFVHPNQFRFAASQVPGVRIVQGIVARSNHKDHFTLRVEVEEGVDETAVSDQLKQAVKNISRVRIDTIEFMPVGTIAADAPGMVDKRQWH